MFSKGLLYWVIKVVIVKLTLPNTKILDWTKVKVLADDKSNVAKAVIFQLKRVQNMWEKDK